MTAALACSQGTPGCPHDHHDDPDPLCETPVALLSGLDDGWAGVTAQRFADGQRSVGLAVPDRVDLTPQHAVRLALALCEAAGTYASSCSRCGRPTIFCVCTHRTERN